MKAGRGISLQRGFNCRDLGCYPTCDGLTVKAKRLIRAGYLSDLNFRDQKKLYDYGIRTVIDLRSPFEVRKFPDLIDNRIQYIKMPISNEDLTESTVNVRNLVGQLTDKKAGHHQMVQTYQRLLTDSTVWLSYRHFFLTLSKLSANGVLFHCSTGKDRTGILSIFILSILRVPEKAIMNDYLLSNECSSIRINNRLNEAKTVNNNPAYLQSIFDLSTVRKEYFELVISIINNYGGFDSFFHNQIGLSDAVLNQIRDNYLT
ncbi:tyrosine-protein phosphatase [Secundilactobacillus collinoides]|nr:tyrosine-protein phosphatase [Secundilactobacillus collinoides]